MKTGLEGFKFGYLCLVLTSDVLDLSPEFIILPLIGITVTLELIYLLLHVCQSLCKCISFLLTNLVSIL